MNSLVNYGSDDELDDSSDERSTTATYGSGRSSSKRYGSSQQVEDVNYDEVQMSLSEDSGDESRQSRESSSVASGSYERSRDTRSDRDLFNTKDDERVSRDRYSSRNDREDKYGGRDRDREDTRSSREEDRMRERYRDEKTTRDRRDDRRAKSKERNGNRDDNRYNRDRKDRERRRSRSRDRRSRSPRDRRSRSRDKRSRSRSPPPTSRRDDRFRNERGNRGSSYKRFDRNRQTDNQSTSRIAAVAAGNNATASNNTKNNNSQQQQSSNQDATGGGGAGGSQGFFVPGVTGKYREQIEKRKLLWQKKDTLKSDSLSNMPVPAAASSGNSAPRATKVWEATTFAQDTDGKVANKFKRLMGIKNVSDGNQPATEVLKKQEEMFSSMEQQYEVARTATHTMRGVGLGFGSFQR